MSRVWPTGRLKIGCFGLSDGLVNFRQRLQTKIEALKTNKPSAQLILWLSDAKLLLHTGPPGKVSGGALAEVALSEPFSRSNPVEIGSRLAEAMSQQGIKPGRVIVGLPAAWVSTQTISVPTHDQDVVRGAIKLRVARDFEAGGGGGGAVSDSHSSANSQVAVDYQTVPEGSATVVRLGAVPKDRLTAVLDCCRAAGLTVQRVVPTAQAAVRAANMADGLILGPGGLEFAAQLGQPARAASTLMPIWGEQALDADAVTAQLSYEQASGAVPSNALRLIELPGCVQGAAQDLSDGLGLDAPVKQLPVEDWLLASSNGQVLDLKADRLSQPEKQARPPWQRWAVIGGLLLALVIGYPAVTYWNLVSESKSLEADTELLAPEAAEVEQMYSQIKRVDPWFDGRVSTLACLYEISRLKPARGSLDITGLRLIANESAGTQQGTLTGIASSRNTALAMLEAMRTSQGFKDPTLRDTTPVTGSAGSASGAASKGVRFEIVFGIVAGALGKEAS